MIMIAKNDKDDNYLVNWLNRLENISNTILVFDGNAFERAFLYSYDKNTDRFLQLHHQKDLWILLDDDCIGGLT